jgi:CRP-like cAMP-binding protein
MTGNPFKNFIVRYDVGETIYDEGERGATMYIVQSGKVQLLRRLDDQVRVLCELEKGDFFGEMSILEGLPRTTAAEAVEQAELIEINSMTFDKMIKGNIEIAIRMLRKLSIRLRDAERKLTESDGTGAAARARATPTASASKPQKVEGGLRLELEEGGAAFPVKRDETLIGRFDPVTELNPDVDLTEVDLKRSVSRRHARIVRNGDGYNLVEEIGALNGTFVNGTKLSPGQPHAIEDGDTLGLGMVKLVFRT